MPTDPMTLADVHRPAGSLARAGAAVDLTPREADWSYAGLLVSDVPPGQPVTVDAGDDEVIVLSLGGGAHLDVDDTRHTLHGRASVFDGPSDAVYAPPGARLRITSDTPARVAIARACCRDLPAAPPAPGAHLTADAVRIERRGAGVCARTIRHYTPDTGLPARRLIVCEVVTPAGGWSSYPPHKHDVDSPTERALEEIYYYEFASHEPGSAGDPGSAFGLQRVYAATPPPPERPSWDHAVVVRHGDVVLVPHGYHGPCAAAPGYEMYYLNVMAGPRGDGRWLVSHDPAHAWTRDSDPAPPECP